MWNDVTVDWSSVYTRFGTCSTLGTRMWGHGLVYPLFVAQITWFCSMKEEWVEHGIEDYEVCDGNII